MKNATAQQESQIFHAKLWDLFQILCRQDRDGGRTLAATNTMTIGQTGSAASGRMRTGRTGEATMFRRCSQFSASHLR